jgi:hypothetical protein
LVGNNKLVAIIILLIVVLSVFSGVFIYLEYYVKEKKECDDEESGKEIDDRIAPLENQGIKIEISRIRHRGLLDKMMTPGISWRSIPEFYVICNIDGWEISSKELVTTTLSGESTFKTWDTEDLELLFRKDVDEEWEESFITIKIMECVRTGLLNRKTNNVEKEKIKIWYDYRTGCWSGDDEFKDEDGYRHYRGETFELWFDIYQNDYDNDQIPYWTEVNILGTNPAIDDSNLDPDLDGIPTRWEWRWGYNPFIWDNHKNLDPDIDGIENIEEYKMEKWFADPFQRDIFIEVDNTEAEGFFEKYIYGDHVFWYESQQFLIERFAEQNINVYIDDGWSDGPVNGGGEYLPHYDLMDQDTGMILRFYKHNFADERKGIFRYLVMCHAAGWTISQTDNGYDTIAVGTNANRMWSITGVKRAYSIRKMRLAVAAGVMHEIGHTCGLSSSNWEGIDNTTKIGIKEFKETWANYHSVMSYYQMYEYTWINYSDGHNGPPYDRNEWVYLWLPFFEINPEKNEDITHEFPGYADIDYDINVSYILDRKLVGWNYNETLTKQFIETINDWTPVKNQKFDWRVYVKNDSNDNSSVYNVKVYAMPLIKPNFADYSLIYEGIFESNSFIQFYSIEDQISKILSEI